MIDLEDDSPIGRDHQDTSHTSYDSGDIVATSKVKAGVSIDMDTMAVTPLRNILLTLWIEDLPYTVLI